MLAIRKETVNKPLLWDFIVTSLNYGQHVNLVFLLNSCVYFIELLVDLLFKASNETISYIYYSMKTES